MVGQLVWSIVALACYVLLVGIMIRVVTEIVRSFARRWRPAGVAAVGLEFVYTATDPPVRLLRRIIPPLRIGQVSIDLSVFILLFALVILRAVALHFVSPFG